MLFFLPLLLLVCCGSSRHTVRETVGYVSVQELILSCDSQKNCESKISFASGSATRIIFKEKFYWLTAGHVCKSLAKENEKSVYRSMKVTTLGNEIETAESVEFLVYKDDNEADLCLTSARPGTARKVYEQKLKFGERLHAFAFPDGAYSSGIYPLYEGTYNGEENKFKCLTSIPVSPGSSGAGVIDNNGNLTGVITSVSSNFNHRTIFSCPNATKWFVEVASQTIDKSAVSPQ
jgi:S1-C subfamily serine protease